MHGIKTNLLTTGARPLAAVATAVIGLVCTASATAGANTTALDAAFPLDTPVLVTDVRRALNGLVLNGGTLQAAFEAIADQSSPIVVVVRVAVDADPGDQDNLVIGSSAGGSYTGMQALLAAEAQTGQRPRILGAPGLDTQAVTTALAGVAGKLRAMAYCAAAGDTIAEVATYRENFSQRELMLIWPNFSGGFAGDAVARALGLRAAIDEAQGWHKTISNVAVQGVTGIDRDLFFDLQDESTDVSTLNAADITTLIRANGFRFWGNRTTSDEPLFSFESAVRTSQVLQDKIAEGLMWAVDKPLTVRLIKDVLESINAEFRREIAAGRLIGGKAWYDPALNAEADLAAGKVVLDYDFTPAAPLEGLTLNQRISDRYYSGFADQLA